MKNPPSRSIYILLVLLIGLTSEVHSQYSNFYQYRTYSGIFNDLRNFHEGRAGIALKRKSGKSFYGQDGYQMLYRGNARMISNTVCNQTADYPNKENLSSLVFTFLQFIDHDIIETAESKTEYAPVHVPTGDHYFDPFYTGQMEIPFFRSKKSREQGSDGTRNQINNITAWLDGSVIYGSDEERAHWLRSGECGRLKVSHSPHGDLLPFNTLNGEYDSPLDPDAPEMANDTDHHGVRRKLFVAGDVRANEQPGLTALHVLFAREHNRICDELAAKGQCNDEKNYQYARKIVGGLIQSVLYNELLPILGIYPGSDSYDRNADPGIMNTFATAAFRLGHTMVTNKIPLVHEPCGDPTDYISLAQAFFNPSLINTHGLEAILGGLKWQAQEEIDVKLVDGIRNFLFGPPGAGGLDLAALNIQRGRDHGIPSYNQARDMFGLRRAQRFRDITKDRDTQRALEKAYGHVDRVDAWIGMLAEDSKPGRVFGELISVVLTEQFKNIRKADRFYYTRDYLLSRKTREEIDRTRLSDIIRRNTLLESMEEAFEAGACSGDSDLSYCNSRGQNARYEWIDMVSVNEYHNQSGNNEGYAYFPAADIQLIPGEKTEFFMKTGYRFWSVKEYWRIWVDFDADGSFDRDELVYSSRQYANASGSFRVPEDAALGQTRMRIAMSHYYHYDPCKDPRYGEVEDYAVTIIAPNTSQSRSIAHKSKNAIETEFGKRELDFVVTPNPAITQAWIQIEALPEERAVIEIYDLQGRMIHSRDINISGKSERVAVQVESWTPGQYVAVLRQRDKIVSKQFIVAR